MSAPFRGLTWETAHDAFISWTGDHFEAYKYSEKDKKWYQWNGQQYILMKNSEDRKTKDGEKIESTEQKKCEIQKMDKREKQKCRKSAAKSN